MQRQVRRFDSSGWMDPAVTYALAALVAFLYIHSLDAHYLDSVEPSTVTADLLLALQQSSYVVSNAVLLLTIAALLRKAKVVPVTLFGTVSCLWVLGCWVTFVFVQFVHIL